MKQYEIEEIYEFERDFHDSLANNARCWPRDIVGWEKPSWELILETIGDLNYKRILDIGCGFGRESIMLAKKGAIVTGIDISDKSIEFAKKRVSEEKVRNINFETLNVDKLDCVDSFDVVLCHGSLHHFPDVPSVISKGYESLKSGGIMIAFEPKSENPIAIIGRRFFNPSTPTEHPFKTRELEAIFQNKFGNVDMKYFYVFSPLCFTFEKISSLRSDFLRDITFNVLNFIDESLLHFGIFQKYSWAEVVWSEKK